MTSTRPKPLILTILDGWGEASPGPHDIAYLFDRFIGLMETRA